MFITFEGLDFSGKTTQIELLERYLKEKGRQVQVLREPGGTVIGEKIRDILLDKRHLGMSDFSELFLFSASRAQLVREVIQPALRDGVIVITDRFYDSTTAYQGWGRGLPLDAIKAINMAATDRLVPDVTIFLDLSVDAMDQRMQARSGKDRMESNTKEFYRRVRDGYCDLARTEARYLTIDAALPVEEIHTKIVARVEGV